MEKRPDSWSTDITEADEWPLRTGTFSYDQDKKESVEKAMSPGAENRGTVEEDDRRSSIHSEWSRTTVASRESSDTLLKKSQEGTEKDVKGIDPIFLNDDWESLMQDAKYRATVYFQHCRSNDLVALRYLMLSFPDQFISLVNKKGENGISVAAVSGALEVASYLAKRGADMGMPDKDGRTPLMLATIHGHYSIVEFLLSKGVDTSPRDRKGQTALHFALPYVSGAKVRDSSLGEKKDAEAEESRINIAIRLLRYNLDHHSGEDHLGQNYLSPSSSTTNLLEKGDTSNSPAPDGGQRAWLQVLGTFLIYFNTAGISSSFGVYQTFYPQSFGLATTQASVIGSVQSFLLLFTSVIGGPLYDAGLYKYLLMAGSSLVVLSTFSQSLSSQFYQLLLSQGVGVGFGGGLVGFLGPTILSTYFSTKLPFASGLGALGGGVAGIMYPIMFRNLEPAIGYGWTVRVFTLIVVISLGVAMLVLKPRAAPTGKRVFFDPTALRDRPYLIFVFGNFMINLGLYVPFSFLPTFAKERGLADDNLSLYLIAIMNVGSLFGRVIPSLAATRTGPLNMIILTAVATSLAGGSLLLVNSLPALLMISILYGFSTGAYFALQPVTLISLCPDPARLGSRVGMASAFLAFGALPTSTVAGALLDAVGFQGVWLWGAATTGLGGALMALARIQKAGLVLMTRV